MIYIKYDYSHYGAMLIITLCNPSIILPSRQVALRDLLDIKRRGYFIRCHTAINMTILGLERALDYHRTLFKKAYRLSGFDDELALVDKALNFFAVHHYSQKMRDADWVAHVEAEKMKSLQDDPQPPFPFPAPISAPCCEDLEQ